MTVVLNNCLLFTRDLNILLKLAESVDPGVSIQISHLACDICIEVTSNFCHVRDK